MTDPTVKRYVGSVTQKVRQHPQMQKIVNDARDAFGKVTHSFRPKVANTQKNSQTAGAGGASSRNFYQTATAYWNQHRERVVAFLAANFMGILFFIQFGQQLWHLLLAALSQSSHKSVDDKRHKKQTKEQRKQKAESTALARTPLALDVGCDNGGGEQDLGSIAFAQSFKYKIGDATEFQSSVTSSDLNDGTVLYFDLRSGSNK